MRQGTCDSLEKTAAPFYEKYWLILGCYLNTDLDIKIRFEISETKYELSTRKSICLTD